MTILAVYREPFGITPHVRYLPEGETLAGMRRHMRGLPADFDARGVICINGHPAPRALWGAIRPKPGVVTEVTFHAPLMGGGDDGGKNILALVASIGITLATGFIAGGGLATKFGLSMFASGSVAATVLAAGVSLAGSLLLSALTAPPKAAERNAERDKGSASAEGNMLSANGAIPRVIGQRKVFPPFATEPLTYFDGDDEVVEAVCCLAGPHQLTDIRVASAPIAGLSDIEYETREGWPGDAPLTLATRQSRTQALQSELRGHVVDSTAGDTLDSTTGALSDALPQAQTAVTRDAPDELLLHVVFPQGLSKNADGETKVRVPIRLRLREVGASAWINLPELHFQASQVRQMRSTIRLIWTDDAATTPAAASSEGWVEARVLSPGQTASPSQDDRAADAYFTGSGDGYMAAGNLGTTGVLHVEMDRFTATIRLDTATFAKGRYEIEIIRGAAILAANWDPVTYKVGSTVWDLFGYQGSPAKIATSRNGLSDTVYLLRVVSIWNENPVPTDDFALIAIRARNRPVSAISTVAGGWVQDWDGSGWVTWTVTDNPAPHYRDIVAGRLNADPVPADVVDESGLVAWRTACTTLGYRCNALIEDQSVADAAQIVAACGYTRPYMSEIWGVVRDYDRSGEDPVQIFSPRNMSGYSWTAAFPRLPDGFRVNFRDETRDYEMRQITVPATAKGGLLEQVTYEGLTTSAEATKRALFDLAQARARSKFHAATAPAEAIVCRRGDLVGVWHDMLTGRHGSARVADFDLDGSGAVTAIHLDDSVPVYSEPDFLSVTDLAAEPDFLRIGLVSGAAIRRSDGSVTVHAITGTTGDATTLTLASAASAADLDPENLVVVGPLGREYRRMIVFAAMPKEDLTADLTFVDEAPELFAA